MENRGAVPYTFLWGSCSKPPGTRTPLSLHRQTFAFGRTWLIGLEQLDPIAERVLGIKPAISRDLTVVDDRHTARHQPRSQRFQVIGQQGWVSPAACHGRLDAAMQLLIPAGKPDAAAVSQAGGFFDLRQSKQLGIEASRCKLAPRCDRDLDMVQTGDAHRSSVIRTAA